MNRKAVVSTFCTWSSYGSVLQAYAFRLFLNEMGVDSTLLLSINQKQYVLPDYVTRKQHFLKKTVFSLLNLFFEKKRKQRFKKINHFIETNLDVQYFDDYNFLLDMDFNSDIFISGSDQVFQPSVCDPAFFLDFVPRNNLKVSYAASLGSLKIPGSNKEKFLKLINNFDFLSLRERDAADFISSFYQKPIYVNADPTLLIEKEKWMALSKKYSNVQKNKKYYLVYAIYWDKNYNKLLKQLKLKTGYTIIVISDGLTSIFHDKMICDASIEEFLWLIKNAEGIITSSFHGACFSIIFNKPVSVVINPASPSRLASLVDRFEIPSVPINELDVYCFEYGSINKKIVEARVEAEEYVNAFLHYGKK